MGISDLIKPEIFLVISTWYNNHSKTVAAGWLNNKSRVLGYGFISVKPGYKKMGIFQRGSARRINTYREYPFPSYLTPMKKGKRYYVTGYPSCAPVLI
ncbi:hypothetical protein O5541_27445 [Escherichia coli]|nr:hypothetical protein [Escherichia coli]